MRIEIIKNGAFDTQTKKDLELGQVLNWKKERAETAIKLGYAKKVGK